MSALRRRAWWLLVVMTALFGIFSVGDVVGGLGFESKTVSSISGLTALEIRAQNPDVYRLLDFIIRVGGLTFVTLAVVLSMILLVPYRGGRKWAWWTMWTLPGWMAGDFVLNIATGTASGQGMSDAAQSAPIIGLLAAGALLLDRFRFRSGPSDERGIAG